ncbi:MAG TPA: hypothetical protein VKC51_02680 [Lacunisphaera sp.]|nr:hypothetical protein [Lacunisphaera sp.]
MAVTADGEQLFLQATNQSRLKLRPIAVGRYSITGVKAEIWFERDGAAKAP